VRLRVTHSRHSSQFMEMNLIPVFIKLVTKPYFHIFTTRCIIPQNSILMVVKNILSQSQLLSLHNTYVLQLKPCVYISQYLHMRYNPRSKCFYKIYVMKSRYTIYSLLYNVILLFSPPSESYSVKGPHC
jgi:hypothetical protein